MAIIVKRFDRGELQKPIRLPNGWLKVDGYVGRTGLLEYTHADGSTWTEYRPPDEAFRADVLDSFESVPLTNGHPPTESRLLDASNTKQFQVGTVGRPRQDGKFLRSSIMVTDAEAIVDIEAGRRELSQGYSCELDLTPGTFEGKRYDAVQRNISGNHVALCDRARGGPEIRLRVDSHDSLPVESKQVPGQQPQEEKQVIKIKIDGVTVEVSEAAAELIAKMQKGHADAISAAQSNLDKVTARADSAEASVTKLKADLADAPVKAREAIESRAALEVSAGKLGITEFKGKADGAIRREAVEKAGVKCDGKADAYVEAAFDYALARLATEPGALTPPATPATSKVDEANGDSLEVTQAKGRAMLRDLYKTDSK